MGVHINISDGTPSHIVKSTTSNVNVGVVLYINIYMCVCVYIYIISSGQLCYLGSTDSRPTDHLAQK
jgi:hypothetical protein